jgi:hypothetical protein
MEAAKPKRLNKLRKKCFLVIPSETRDLLFFAKPKKKQIPRANPALRNDSLRAFPQPLRAVLLGHIKMGSHPKLRRRMAEDGGEGRIRTCG